MYIEKHNVKIAMSLAKAQEEMLHSIDRVQELKAVGEIKLRVIEAM